MRILAGLMAAGMMASSASAQNMNAENFHQRALAIRNKGALAIFSRSEIKNLTGEVQAASKIARRQRLAAVKSNKAPRYCPPDGSQKMGSDELINRLEAIPPADRSRIDMTEAMTRILAGKFPCRAG